MSFYSARYGIGIYGNSKYSIQVYQNYGNANILGRLGKKDFVLEARLPFVSQLEAYRV